MKRPPHPPILWIEQVIFPKVHAPIMALQILETSVLATGIIQDYLAPKKESLLM